MRLNSILRSMLAAVVTLAWTVGMSTGPAAAVAAAPAAFRPASAPSRVSEGLLEAAQDQGSVPVIVGFQVPGYSLEAFAPDSDRKSTHLNSSHRYISYS